MGICSRPLIGMGTAVVSPFLAYTRTHVQCTPRGTQALQWCRSGRRMGRFGLHIACQPLLSQNAAAPYASCWLMWWPLLRGRGPPEGCFRRRPPTNAACTRQARIRVGIMRSAFGLRRRLEGAGMAWRPQRRPWATRTDTSSSKGLRDRCVAAAGYPAAVNLRPVN